MSCSAEGKLCEKRALVQGLGTGALTAGCGAGVVAGLWAAGALGSGTLLQHLSTPGVGTGRLAS
jgi:hypothetical protein